MDVLPTQRHPSGLDVAPMTSHWLVSLLHFSGRSQYRFWMLLCGLCLVATQATAGEPVLDIGHMDANPISLTSHFSVFEDSSQRLQLEDVQKPDMAAQFKAGTASGESLSFSYTASAMWLRLHVQNTSNAPVVRMLEISNPLLAHLTFYQPVNDQGYQATQTGYALPFATRPHASRFFVLPIRLPAHADQMLFFRVATPNSMILPVKLWELQAFHAHERADYVFSVLTLATFVGVGAEYIWGGVPFFTKMGTNVFLAIALTAFLLFTRRMLFTAERLPVLDRLLKLFVWINVAFCGLFFLSFEHVARLFVISYAITALLLLVTGTVSAYKRERSAYFFMAAFAVVLLALGMLAMRQLGVLPTNAWTTSGAQIGSALEMLLLSFALADRYNVMRRDKDSAQQRLVENLRTSEAILEDRVVQRTTELEVLNQRLEALSTIDGLTGIANRRHFDKLFAAEWLRCMRLGQPLALAMVDIDWFKKYNDHSDIVARYGGEEFVFFAPATDAEGALNMAEQLCAELEAAALPHAFSTYMCVTASIGVAVVVPSEVQAPAALIQAADAALYLAKKQGRNRAVLGTVTV